MELCQCQYVVGTVNSRDAIVFIQGPLRNTSVTNVIEAITTKVLADSFPEVDPTTVDIYEHYPPHLRPIREWQKVEFEVYKEEESGFKGLILRVTEMLFGPGSRHYYVSHPVWSGISDSVLIAELQAVIV